MKRLAEQRLFEWISSKNRKPLIIRGARQVGKSTVIRNFSAQHNKTLHEINLEKNLKLDTVFRKLNIADIIRELELLSNRGRIDGENSVVFLDEIQAVPSAIPALRYFFEERPDIPVVAAGSLLEFTLSREHFSMPVGRIEYLYLGPMSFQEYLMAQNEGQLIDYMQGFSVHTPPSEAAHGRLLTRLREYLLVGGMPEAVRVFTDTGRFEDAFKVHDSIIETYREDFSKYASFQDLIRLQKVFDYVPSTIGEKFKYVNINSMEKSADMRRSADLLARAGIFHHVTHSSCSGLPLQSGAKEKVFKPLFLDVGLMNDIRGIHALSAENVLSRQFMNEGKMAEQFIGQHVLYLNGTSRHPSLHYWLREEKTGGAEVDYVVSVGETIVPVEVKAGLCGSLKSLLQFAFQKKSRLCVRFDQHQPSFHPVQYALKNGDGNGHVQFNFLSLPLYMVDEFPRLVQEALAV